MGGSFRGRMNEGGEDGGEGEGEESTGTSVLRTPNEYMLTPFQFAGRKKQTTRDAEDFYDRKVDELGVSLKSLEGIVQGKSNTLRVVEDGGTPSALLFFFTFSFRRRRAFIRLFGLGTLGRGMKRLMLNI